MKKLKGKERSIQSFRWAVNDWGPNGDTIEAPAFPKTKGDENALIKGEKFFLKKEWTPISPVLQHYGFPHKFKLQINPRYRPAANPGDLRTSPIP